MNTQGGAVKTNRRIRIEKPSIRTPEQEILWRAVHKYAQMIPSEPEPNQGRLEEIKEEIQKGTYITPDKIEETVARLAIRFMKQE